MKTIETISFKRKALSFSNTFQYQNVSYLFTKALYCYLLLKLVWLSPLYDLFFEYYYNPKGFFPTSLLKDLLSKIFFFPIIQEYHLIIMLICIFIVLSGILLRPNYLFAILIYLISYNFSKLSVTINNGADFSLNLFLFLSIFMCTPKNGTKSILSILKNGLANFSVWICRLQIGLIYLVSGYNKLGSAHWRSGMAIEDILKLDYFILPGLFNFPITTSASLVIAWGVILFECTFVFLIQYKHLKHYTLALGILMHLGIIIFLSLPDFGLVMIISYLIYFSESQAGKFKQFFSVVK